MKLTFDCVVISVNVTGERAFGPGLGGVFNNSAAEYDRPVRSGEGLGDGCCARAWTAAKKKSRI